VLLAVCSAAHAAEEEKVTLNFVGADIEAVVKAVGAITNRNFILDPRVKGTVNIVSARPVARDLVYQILLSALRLQGFAAVEGHGVTKIVPEADAKQNFSVTSDKPVTVSGDRMVTQVYPLQYESAVQLVPVLRPLIAPNNVIAAYPNNNTLVIVDYADNVRRINRIIEAIDKPNDGEIAVIKLQHASALDMAQVLNKLMPENVMPGMPGAVAPGTGVQQGRLLIVPEARSNSLFIRSDNPARLGRLRELVASLDQPGNTAANIHVVYLRNAEAVKLAQTLRATLTGEAPPAPAAAPAAGTAAQPAAATAGSGMVQADAATNALIINAPDVVYNTLRAVIEKLDTRRAQVFVEALIVEISADKAAEFGIQWMAPIGSSGPNSAVVGGTSFGSGASNIMQLAAGSTLPAAGLNLGLLRRFTVGGKEVETLALLARALQSDVNANILATPNLLTLDNEEAKIVIGQNVPFITGQYAQTGTTTTPSPFQTIERKDVGLTLKVKPQVSESGTVKLVIYQEVSSVQDTTNSAGLITNKRSIDSTVLVDDGRIVVLGGLIQDTLQDGVDKVPGLGDLPVLGSLFRYEKRKRVKTNLMVFLRPYVLRSDTASDSLTGDRYEYLRHEQVATEAKRQSLLPDMPVPQLPELTLGKSVPGAGKAEAK
jgi:general secretion pathway protein D